MNIETISIDDKSIVKTPFQIPSPTILLPNEFSSSPKPISNTRNLLTFNQSTSFHLKNVESNLEKISTSSINSLNLIQPLSLSNTTITPQQLQISHYEGFTIHKPSQDSISSSQQIFPTKQPALILPRFVDKPILSNRILPSPRISLPQMIDDTDFYSNPNSTLSQDLDSPSFKFTSKKINNENIQNTDTLSFELSSQTKIKHEPESLWKTKLTLKTILSMANRDEAQALKDRKPIDYHMFLSNKFTKNSIFQYNDHIDMKFTAKNKQSILQQFNEQDYKENRKLYKRLLDTMGLRKPVNITEPQSNTFIKQIKTKRRPKMKLSTDNSLQHSNENPILIRYQALPI